MSSQQQATVVFTLVAAGTIKGKRCITYDGVQAGDGGGTGVAIAGIADHDGVAGDAIRIIQGSTAMVEAGAALNGSESRLKTDAQGRVIAWTTGSVICARLRIGQTATAAGDLVEVIPYIEN
jgi:hypothetical protein